MLMRVEMPMPHCDEAGFIIPSLPAPEKSTLVRVDSSSYFSKLSSKDESIILNNEEVDVLIIETE